MTPGVITPGEADKRTACRTTREAAKLREERRPLSVGLSMDEAGWVFDLPERSLESTYDPDGLARCAEGPFTGLLQREIVRPGIALYRVEGVVSHASQLSALGDAPAGHLVLGAMLAGAGTMTAEGNEDAVWNDDGRFYAVSLAGRKISYRLAAGKPWRAVTLILTPEALEDLAMRDGLPPLPRAVLANGLLPVARMQALGASLARTAAEISRPAYGGTMGGLWREAKALELLTHSLDALAETSQRPETLSPREISRVHEARARLLANLGSPPRLDDLADEVGLSSKRLNSGFRQLFGMTVFDYLLEARLRAARRAIEEGLDMPLKQLAWSLGYRQLSNFVTAYRRRFGVSPGRHRRTRSAD